jgi:hypothetical protein
MQQNIGNKDNALQRPAGAVGRYRDTDEDLGEAAFVTGQTINVNGGLYL